MAKKFFSLLLVTLMILSIGITKTNRVYADNSKIFEGVWQGNDGTTFAKDAKTTNIFIIEDKVDDIDDANAATTWINPKAESDGFYIGDGFSESPMDTTSELYEQMLIIATYDEKKRESRLSGEITEFSYDDPIATYTFKEAAQLGDGSLGDVVVAYEKVKLIPEKTEYNSFYGDVSLGTGNGFHGNVKGSSARTGGMQRIGVMIEINVYVVKEGEKIDGSFYFPVKGITIDREKQDSWHDAFNEKHSKEHCFSEGFIVDGGFLANKDGYSFFVPGTGTSGIQYTPAIEKYDNNTYFYGKGSGDGDNSYYTGFLCVADNTNGGIETTFIMGVAIGPDRSYGINNNILHGHTKDGDALIHQIKATTGKGGEVETIDSDPNYNSDTNPLLAVPTGKTMTYKMTPKPGYKLKKVTVNNGSIDYTGGQEVTPEEHIAEDGSVYYTYKFPDIFEDNSLHVEWEPCEYHIDYDANGGEGTMDPQDFTGADETMKSKDNAFTREGYHFTGFKALDKDGNPVKDKDGKELPLFETAEDFKAYLIALGDGAKITLQAQWEPDEYTIKYDPNGGEGTMTEQHFSGTDKEAKSKPNAFTAGGFDFMGFKAKDKDGNYLKDKDGNDLVFANPADFISYLKKQGNGGEITLVAQWRKKEYKSPIPKTGVE